MEVDDQFEEQIMGPGDDTTTHETENEDEAKKGTNLWWMLGAVGSKEWILYLEY